MATRIFLIIILLFVACAGENACSQTPQPQTAKAPQQFAELGDFKLQSGSVVYSFRVGYRTIGALNPQKSNAVLWPTWLGGRSEDLLQYVGPGKVVDSSKYFVIVVDAIANGVSTSPSNSSSQPLMKFPKVTIRDMVESQHRLLTEVLHLPHLHAVIGLSMGGMQAFEWAVVYPDFMDITIPMAGSPQSTSYDKLLWTSEIDGIELDPAWNNGNPKGLLTRGPALAEEIDKMNSTSPAYRTTHTKTNDFAGFLAEIRKGTEADGGAASDQIRQREAIIALDLPHEFGVPVDQVAKRVRSKMLVVISPQDQMVNPGPALDFARAIGGPILILDSPCGHISFSCISVGPTVTRFLDNPSSVHSETLRDPSAH